MEFLTMISNIGAKAKVIAGTGIAELGDVVVISHISLKKDEGEILAVYHIKGQSDGFLPNELDFAW